MELSAALIALGSVLAPPVYTAWRRKRGFTPENTTSLQQLVATDHRDTLAAHNIHADIEWLASYTAQSLLPIFKLDGSDLSDSDQAAVVCALTDTIQSGGQFPHFLLAHNLDVHQVTANYRQLGATFRRQLPEKGSALYDACLPELIRRLIAVADRIPGFNSKFHQRVLANQAHFIDQGRPIIDELSRFLEIHKSNRRYLVDNFAYELKASISDRLGSVYILGLDTADLPQKLPLDISYLSVRAELTKARALKDPDVSPVDIPSEYILKHSKRVLLRGNAGSGKTTLLQWISLQCVNKSFSGDLTVLHGYIPFFIRLRDFYDSPLPTGRDLFAGISRFLVDSVEDAWLRDILYRGRGLFLIDGLDEVSEEQRTAVLEWLSDLTRHTPDSTFVVTSRPTAVKTDFLRELNFDEYFLKPMTPDEVDSFVEYWHDALRETQHPDADAQKETAERQKILERLLTQNRSLKRFASTPLLAAVVCTLSYNAKLDLVNDRFDLYEVTARLLYHDRVLRKDIKDPLYESLSRAEKEAYLAEIALWMIWNGKTTCTLEHIGKIVERCRGTVSEASGRRQNSAIASALVLRSGILHEVTPESIQFMHKTFQEYFGAIAAVKTENEVAIARHLDLTEWTELFRVAVVKTNHPLANQMVEVALERAREVKERRSAYVLLAAAATQDCLGISQEVRQKAKRRVARLVPPSSAGVVYDLAQAGELVVPLLAFNGTWASSEMANSVAVLAQIDLPESAHLIQEYAEKAPLDIDLVVRLFEAVDYKNDERFGRMIISALRKRNTPYFYKRGRKPRLYISSSALVQFSNLLPKARTVVIDCRWKLNPEAALWALDDLRGGVQELTIITGDCHWNGEALRRFELLTELNIVGGNLESMNFLSSLGRLRTVRTFGAQVDDWDGLEYADLSSLFVRGLDESSLEALGPVAERWATSPRRLYLDLGSIEKDVENIEPDEVDQELKTSFWRDHGSVSAVAIEWSEAEQENVLGSLGVGGLAPA